MAQPDEADWYIATVAAEVAATSSAGRDCRRRLADALLLLDPVITVRPVGGSGILYRADLRALSSAQARAQAEAIATDVSRRTGIALTVSACSAKTAPEHEASLPEFRSTD